MLTHDGYDPVRDGGGPHAPPRWSTHHLSAEAQRYPNLGAILARPAYRRALERGGMYAPLR